MGQVIYCQNFRLLPRERAEELLALLHAVERSKGIVSVPSRGGIPGDPVEEAPP